MAIPANVKTAIQSGFHHAHEIRMGESVMNVQSANNIVRHSAARMVDEPSPQQARAIDKILRLPVKA
jgi:hypothetical protein